jgi:hypothetical protein
VKDGCKVNNNKNDTLYWFLNIFESPVRNVNPRQILFVITEQNIDQLLQHTIFECVSKSFFIEFVSTDPRNSLVDNVECYNVIGYRVGVAATTTWRFVRVDVSQFVDFSVVFVNVVKL